LFLFFQEKRKCNYFANLSLKIKSAWKDRRAFAPHKPAPSKTDPLPFFNPKTDGFLWLLYKITWPDFKHSSKLLYLWCKALTNACKRLQLIRNGKAAHIL